MSKSAKREKKPGDVTERALEEVDKHRANAAASLDPVPVPETGGHSHSHAAHLGAHAREHTKPAGGLQQGTSLGELREPPMVVNRVGKEHRKQ